MSTPKSLNVAMLFAILVTSASLSGCADGADGIEGSDDDGAAAGGAGDGGGSATGGSSSPGPATGGSVASGGTGTAAGGSDSGGAGSGGNDGGGGSGGSVAMCAEDLATDYNQGQGWDGVMFDVSAITDVTITGLDVNLFFGFVDTHDVEVYHRPYSHSGSEDDPAAWTLVGSASALTSLGAGVPTPLPFAMDITMAAGERHGFYVTTLDGDGYGLDYAAGTAIGKVYESDGHIEIREGIALGSSFGPKLNQGAPRQWNGTIHYEQSAACAP